MDVTVPCICPPLEDVRRHPDGDTIGLVDTLDFFRATAIRKSLAFINSDDPEARAVEVLARLSLAYVMFGIDRWTVVDAKGKAVPVSHAAIRSSLLANDTAASIVVEAADELYQQAVLLPLMAGASTSSPPMPTGTSTSRPTGSSRKRRKPSSPSSTITTPMDGIEMTSQSLDGDFNSSQSLT